MTITARHLAMWARAHEVTKPAADEQPPTYGAWHRQRAERRMPTGQAEVEADPPKLEALDAE